VVAHQGKGREKRIREGKRRGRGGGRRHNHPKFRSRYSPRQETRGEKWTKGKLSNEKKGKNNRSQRTQAPKSPIEREKNQSLDGPWEGKDRRPLA